MVREIEQVINWSLSAFTDYKLLFERSISFSDDAVHIFAGTMIQLAVAAMFRSSVARIGPLLTVVALEFANEILDIRHELWPSASMQLGESIKDISLTLALPIVLFMVSRRAPAVLVASSDPGLLSEGAEAAGALGRDERGEASTPPEEL